MRERTFPFIIGEKCYLRQNVPSDAAGNYPAWLNDYETTRYLAVGRFPSDESTVLDYIQRAKDDPNEALFAICDRATDQHIGNTTLHDLNNIHRRATFGILIGEKSFWGRGYASEATFLVVDYGFRRHNLHSICLGVLEANVAAIKVYEKVGFKIDGVEREAWWADGRYHNLVRMSILAREHFARVGGP